MPKDFCDVTIILDRSGSMQAIREATVAGINEFVADQRRVPGDGCYTLVQFDNEYETVLAQVPQDKMIELNQDRFMPRGSTALVDAVCRTIDEAGTRLEKMAEADRPNKVLMVIMTDGEENASKKFTAADMAARIARQRDTYGWQFLFLAANQDAIATAGRYGIHAKAAVNFAATARGTAGVYRAASAGARGWKADGNLTAIGLLDSAEPDKLKVEVKVTK